MYIDKLFKIIKSPYISEKTSNIRTNNNIIVIKVSIKSTKKEIKLSIKKLFNIKIKSINTLIIKGKIKKNKTIIGKRKNWKKAYVFLEKNQKLDFIEK